MHWKHKKYTISNGIGYGAYDLQYYDYESQGNGNKKATTGQECTPGCLNLSAQFWQSITALVDKNLKKGPLI